MKKDLYIILSVIYLEIIYHFFTFYDANILGPILSCLAIGFILIFIKNLFSKKINKIVFYILYFVLMFIYELQFIYYKMMGYVCSVASLKMAGDAATGYENIIGYVLKNWYVVLLLLLPFVILLVFNKKINFEKGINYKKLIYSFGTHIVFLLFLLIGKNKIYSSYNLYYNLPQPLMMAQKLGVLTEVRLDIQRTMFGLNEKVYSGKKVEYDDSYNILDIDFDKTTNNKKIDELNKYFKYNSATKKNEYTGIYKDKNVIYILAESLYPIAIIAITKSANENAFQIPLSNSIIANIPSVAVSPYKIRTACFCVYPLFISLWCKCPLSALNTAFIDLPFIILLIIAKIVSNIGSPNTIIGAISTNAV